MGTYRSVSVSFWTDTKVYDEFTWSERYLYLYFLTNAHTNICGCYEISKKQIVQETGMQREIILEALDRLEHTHQVVRYCEKTKELLILNWSRYNWSNSDKLKSAVLGVAQHIKWPPFKDYVLNLANPQRKKEAKKETETVSVTDTDTVSVSDTVSDTDSVTDVSIGYGYPMDRVSEAGIEAEAENSRATEQKNKDFERLWLAYPSKRRSNKRGCRDLFDSVDVPIEKLLCALERQKASKEWEKEDGKYIPGLFKWLSESRWQTAMEAPVFTPGQAEKEAIEKLKRLRDSLKEEP